MDKSAVVALCTGVALSAGVVGLATGAVIGWQQTREAAALPPPAHHAEAEPVTRSIGSRVRVQADHPLTATCKGRCHLTVAPQEASVVEVPYRAADYMPLWLAARKDTGPDGRVAPEVTP